MAFATHGAEQAKQRHLVSICDLQPREIVDLFERASRLRSMPDVESARLLRGRAIATAFFQPSTRTRLGFESAAVRLGADVLVYADEQQSDDYGSEDVRDLARALAPLCDCIVMRHYVTHAAARAAEVSETPVINAGDGTNEHPVQALVDLWVLHQRFGSLRGLKLGFVGDPNARVFRSVIRGLLQFKPASLSFLFPGGCELPTEYRSACDREGVSCEVVSDIRELVEQVHALEMVPLTMPNLGARPDTIRPNRSATPPTFRMTRELASLFPDVALLHPGPRTDELPRDTDGLRNSFFFKQVRDSVYMRMAVLESLLH